MVKKLLIGLSLLTAQACWAADTYNPNNNQLTIPSVEVSGTTYKDVLITVGRVVSVQGGAPKASIDSYNATLNQLNVPSVTVNGVNYSNVVITVGEIISVGGLAPLKVYPTSYENKNSIFLDNPKIPSLNDVIGVKPELGEQSFGLRSVAFADFLQDGSYSAIAVSTFFKNVYPSSNSYNWSDSPGKIYIIKKDSAGNWQDITSNLIKDSKQRYICITPGFIQIADFNNDKKPDAYFSCTGPDFKINGVWDDSSLQYMLLSQPDGTYKSLALPIPKMYSHQASAADFDGDGNIDIISVNPRTDERPLILYGNGDGTFRMDKTKFPLDMSNKSINGIIAIPENGVLNILVSGNTPGWTNSSLSSDYGFKILQYKSGSFQYVKDLTPGIPKVSALGTLYQLALDAIYLDGYYYTIWYDGTFQYSAIVKMNAITGASQILSESKADSSNSGPTMLIKLTSQNNIVSQMAACNQYSYIPRSYYYYECSYSIPAK
jgi:hypothetical protein